MKKIILLLIIFSCSVCFGADIYNPQDQNNVDINGGTIDGATIGATTASSGLFTTIGASGAVTMGTATANAGVFSMIQGAVASDPTFSVTQATNDVTIAQTVGDIKLNPTGDEVIITNGSKLQVNSAGDDKNIQVYHDDTNANISSSSGDIVLTPFTGSSVTIAGSTSNISTSEATMSISASTAIVIDAISRFKGGVAYPTVTKAFADTGYTITSADYTVLVNAVGGATTINLPTAASVYDATTLCGQIFNIKKIDASGNAVTIQANGAETIDGDNSPDIAVQYTNIQIQSNGTGWDVL